MSLILVTTENVKRVKQFDYWCSVSNKNPPELKGALEIHNLSEKLEASVAKQADCWWSLGRVLSRSSDAILAHMPHCTFNASDFGLMLGWRDLAESWINGQPLVLLVCDDPWLFREILSMGAVKIGRSPSLKIQEWRLFIRGIFARTKVTIRVLWEHLLTMSSRQNFPKKSKTLIVYGHSSSRPDGHDGYFGSLMSEEKNLMRVLHVDCIGSRREFLVDRKRTFSLHAWGSFIKAVSLPFFNWSPSAKIIRGKYGWLIRRAAMIESGTGQAAMIRWQQFCQQTWLKETQPKLILWPWENHGWERDLVRISRSLRVSTIGYQHTVVGRSEWNYACYGNQDGRASLPDKIFTNGPAGLKSLQAFGHSAEFLTDMGAFRLSSFEKLSYDPEGPVFVALPFEKKIAIQMLDAVLVLAGKPWNFLVKDHPMTPFSFLENDFLRRTNKPLEEHVNISKVIYAATTVGLESFLGGIPTIRFVPEKVVSNDPIPEAYNILAASKDSLRLVLESKCHPSFIDVCDVFSKPDIKSWCYSINKN